MTALFDRAKRTLTVTAGRREAGSHNTVHLRYAARRRRTQVAVNFRQYFAKISSRLISKVFLALTGRWRFGCQKIIPMPGPGADDQQRGAAVVGDCDQARTKHKQAAAVGGGGFNRHGDGGLEGF